MGIGIQLGIGIGQGGGKPVGPSVEHVVNGDMGSAVNWTLPADWAIGAGLLTHSTGTTSADNAMIPLVSGQTYTYTVVFTAPTTTAILQLRMFDGVTTQNVVNFAVGTTGTQSSTFVANANHTTLRLAPFGGPTGCSIDSVSIVGPS